MPVILDDDLWALMSMQMLSKSYELGKFAEKNSIHPLKKCQ